LEGLGLGKEEREGEEEGGEREGDEKRGFVTGWGWGWVMGRWGGARLEEESGPGFFV
jgi:hypothetical protein